MERTTTLNIMKVVITLVAITMMICAIFTACSSTNVRLTEDDLEIYTVRSGDTVWQIAKETCPNGMHFESYVNWILEYNEIKGYIYPGDRIYVAMDGLDYIK